MDVLGPKNVLQKSKIFLSERQRKTDSVGCISYTLEAFTIISEAITAVCVNRLLPFHPKKHFLQKINF